MHFSKIFKVKEGKLETFKKWLDVLNTERRQEALDTFKHENITREAFILFKGKDGQDYVIGLNEVQGEIKSGDPTVAINQEHSAKMKECLESISERGEIILDLF